MQLLLFGLQKSKTSRLELCVERCWHLFTSTKKFIPPHIEATAIVPFWFQDPVQNNSPDFTDFSGTCSNLLHLILLGLDPLLATEEAEKLPEVRS